MKKVLFAAFAVIMLTAFSFKTNSYKKATMSITITNIEKIADGNKVYFEIITDIPSPYSPALLISTSYNKKTGRYDWGGNPFPQDMVTIGSTTTGYFLDAPFKSQKTRYYKIMDWDADGNLVYSNVYTD